MVEVQCAGEAVVPAEDATAAGLLDEHLLDPPAPRGDRCAAAPLAPVATAASSEHPRGAPMDAAVALDDSRAAAGRGRGSRAHRPQVMRAEPVADGRVAPTPRPPALADREPLLDERREPVSRQGAARP